jgi:hypothetical protein
VGHARVLRLHALPLAPFEAFTSMRSAEIAVTLATMAIVGAGAYRLND